MSIVSLVFTAFIFVALLFYYLVPKKCQWVVLLFASLIFYVVSSSWGIIFVIITSATIFASTNWIAAIRSKQTAYIRDNKETLSKEEKNRYKAQNKLKCKRIMIVTLLINFGILCIFKYAHFAVEQINDILSLFTTNLINNDFQLLAVLGISFYTFQATGYLVDVYWGTVDAQKNYFKTLLFVSFFPQVTQGPISDYAQLNRELHTGHNFDYSRFAKGFQRAIWGIFKKMVIADCLAFFVNDAFQNYGEYSGIVCLLAAFAYSAQIYADFSGYMDIMCGICDMFGITLAENFMRPYFSKSIAEYWRRWHMTLGEWFKKYIYYPIGVSKWNRNIGKRAQAKFGKHVGQALPASIALVVVWLTTGLWHGASWAYIAWGGVNGLFIIFSYWMEPVYVNIQTKLNLRESCFGWRAFRVIRTFILVTFIKVLPEVGTLRDGLGFIGRIFTDYSMPASFAQVLLNSTDKLSFVVAIMGVGLMFILSLLQRKKTIRERFNKFPLFVRVGVLSVLIMFIFIFGVANDANGGFMYAQF